MFIVAINNFYLASSPIRDIDWFLRQPLMWAALGIMAGPYLFYRGFRDFQRERLMLNIPRTSVRAAAIGGVEIAGKAVGPYTLTSPLTERDCLYYRTVIRVRSSNSPIINEACAPLFIDDGTGEMMINPHCAELQLPCFEADTGPHVARNLSRHGLEDEDLKFAREYCILPNDYIFILGTLRENPWATPASAQVSCRGSAPDLSALAKPTCSGERFFHH